MSSYLDKNTFRITRKARLNLEFLNSLEFLARLWQHGESQPTFQPSSYFPFSSPSYQRFLACPYGLPSLIIQVFSLTPNTHSWLTP